MVVVVMNTANKLLSSKISSEKAGRETRHMWEDNIKIDPKEMGTRMSTGFSWLRIGQWWGFVQGVFVPWVISHCSAAYKQVTKYCSLF
jgi:hypothetical protein